MRSQILVRPKMDASMEPKYTIFKVGGLFEMPTVQLHWALWTVYLFLFRDRFSEILQLNMTAQFLFGFQFNLGSSTLANES